VILTETQAERFQDAKKRDGNFRRGTAVALAHRPQGLIPPVEGSRFVAAKTILRDRG
jgi:hypothetical protein